MEIESFVRDSLFAAGIVVASGVKVAPSPPELVRLIDELVRLRSREEFPPAPVKESVRKLLKRGGFKPSGRNKPAGEYLAQAARENRFPRINNLVDVNNLFSLETGLPASLLDLRAFKARACLRTGKPGEKYVFNSAGQEIDLEGLICVCGEGNSPEGIPLGNPVKDSMAGKLTADTESVLGVIYAATDCEAGRGMAGHVARFARLLEDFGGAAEISTKVIGKAELL